MRCINQKKWDTNSYHVCSNMNIRLSCCARKHQSQNNLKKAQNWDIEVHANAVGKYNDKDCVSSVAHAMLQKEIRCCILAKL